MKAPKLTIAQCRAKEAQRLADMGDGNYDKAVSIMNSFYRLCGLCERNLYLANDERWCNTKHCKESEAKEARWVARLNKQFAEYGLQLVYCGYCPSIGTVHENGGFSEVITRWFY